MSIDNEKLKGVYIMKVRILITSIVILAMVVSSVSLYGQNRRVGTSAAPELLIPIGAKEFAKGGSAIATTTGVEAIYWNVAGLGRLGHSAEAMFSNMQYIDNIAVNYGAVGANFGDFGSIALSLKSLNMGDILITTVSDPDGLGGRIFSPAYVTVGLSYGRALTDAIAAGLTVKVVSEQIDRVSSAGVAFDFGVQYNRLGGVAGLALGVAVKNIGPQMKFDGPGLLRDATASDGSRPVQKYKSEAASFELPSVVEIGVSYTTTMSDNMSANLNGTFTNNNLFLDEYHLGGEVGLKLEGTEIFGRIGGVITPKGDNTEQENIFGAAFGLGVQTNAAGIEIGIDYAYRSVSLFSANQVFSVKFGF